MPESPHQQALPRASASRFHSTTRLLILLATAAGFLTYILLTFRWPLIWDAQVLHYVSFLIDRGWAPYRQIGDMNMPGAYLLEHTALAVFGKSDLGWRIFEFSLAATLAAAMASIARRYDWVAGVLAPAIFTVAHAADGPRQAGQRDQVMAVLLIVACALLLESVRRRKPWLMLPFGFCAAMPASVKPLVVLLGPLFLLLALRQLRREALEPGGPSFALFAKGGVSSEARSFSSAAAMPLRKQYRSLAAYFLFALAGFATAAIVVILFLAIHHSIGAFVYTVTHVLPHYAILGSPGWRYMVKNAIQPPIAWFIVAAVLIAVLNRGARHSWEMTVLLLGAFFGLINYFAQQKGFLQHRYTFLVFALLWASIQMLQAMRQSGPIRLLAAASVGLMAFVYAPRELILTRQFPSHDYLTQYLESDLNRLGPLRLQNQVQCLDIVDGCMTALFHLQIVQNTGATGDLLLFLPQKALAVDEARQQYTSLASANSPDVFVLTNARFQEERSFAKIDTWPAFANHLRVDYDMTIQRSFPDNNPPTSDPLANPAWPAYRIYVRHHGSHAP